MSAALPDRLAAAGASVTPETLARAGALGIEPRAWLADNDGRGLLRARGDQPDPHQRQ